MNKLHFTYSLQLILTIEMRDVSTNEEDGDFIDIFSIPVSALSSKYRMTFSGEVGIANITLGYILTCSNDGKDCEEAINIPTLEGKQQMFVMYT